jgi:hypothetical protein
MDEQIAVALIKAATALAIGGAISYAMLRAADVIRTLGEREAVWREAAATNAERRHHQLIEELRLRFGVVNMLLEDVRDAVRESKPTTAPLSGFPPLPDDPKKSVAIVREWIERGEPEAALQAIVPMEDAKPLPAPPPAKSKPAKPENVRLTAEALGEIHRLRQRGMSFADMAKLRAWRTEDGTDARLTTMQLAGIHRWHFGTRPAGMKQRAKADAPTPDASEEE